MQQQFGTLHLLETLLQQLVRGYQGEHQLTENVHFRYAL